MNVLKNTDTPGKELALTHFGGIIFGQKSELDIG
jgi:hypothetical protein